MFCFVLHLLFAPAILMAGVNPQIPRTSTQLSIQGFSWWHFLVIAEEWRHLNSHSLAHYISFLQLYNRFLQSSGSKQQTVVTFSVGQECECDLTSAVKVWAAAMVSSEGSTERGLLLSSLMSRVQLFTGNWIFLKIENN